MCTVWCSVVNGLVHVGIVSQRLSVSVSVEDPDSVGEEGDGGDVEICGRFACSSPSS